MKRIPSLDGLRAISISLVVVGHWASLRYGSATALSFAILGVRIFFVISGYLITTLLLAEHSKTNTICLRDFYIRRSYRILPAAFAFTLPIFFIYRHELRWFDAAAGLLYLANYDPRRPWFMGHLWSLSVEEQFYFLWPSVLKRWFKHRVAILLSVIAFAPIFRIFCYVWKIPGDEAFPAVADNLAVGCLLAVFASRLPKIKRSQALAMLSMISLIPTYLAVTRTHTIVLLFLLWPLLNLSIAGIIVHVVQNPYKLLNISPVVWLGKISYSLYLWQQLFVYGPHRVPWYYMLLVLLPASISYYCVEQPMLRMRDASKKRGRVFAPVGNPKIDLP